MESTDLHAGLEPQLFVDNALIECAQAVTRRWHKPGRHPAPLIVRDRPWEHTPYFTYSNYTVLRDPADGLVKCWYEDLNRLTPGSRHPMRNRQLYAVSRDGLTFEKPELDICPLGGRPTNIVMGHADGAPASPENPWAEEGVHSANVCLDPFPSRPEDRFRCVFSRCVPSPERWRHATSCARSADGLIWEPYSDTPVFGASGSQLGDVSCLWYDSDSRDFVQNTRRGTMFQAPHPADTPRLGGWFGPYYPHRPDLQNKRRIFQTRSHDFIHWTDPTLLLGPDDDFDNLDEGLYGMGQFRVGRVHFGLLGIFRHTDSEMDVRLVFSRDGRTWTPADRGIPFLAPRGDGAWDAHLVSMTSPPIPEGDIWRFYHGGAACHHDWWMAGDENLDHPEARDPEAHVRFGLGLATLRREGFASLDASAVRSGYVLTRPLRSNGSRLRLNAACRPGGSVRVAVLDRANGSLAPCSRDACDVFTGDATRHLVTWQGSPDIPAGDGWRKLYIELRRASLFSFRFEDPAATSD
jgi:hypothetical protein